MPTPHRLPHAALLSLLLATPAFAANGTWLNPVSGLWSDPTKWSVAIADGANAVASFNKLNITSDLTVHLDSPRTVGSIFFDDDVTPSNNWTLDNNANPLNTLTLDSNGTPSITVDNTAVTIALTLAGTKGLNKLGAGTLILTTPAAYTSSTKLTQGVLRITGDNFLPTASDTNVDGVLDIRNANQTFSGPLTGTGLITTSGTAGTLTLSSSAPTYTLTAGLSGPLALVKNNAGELTLDSPQSNTGPTLLNQGSIKLARDNGLSFNTPLTLAAGTTFNLNGHSQTFLASPAGTGTITNTAATLGTLSLLNASTITASLAGNLNVNFNTGSVTLSAPASYTGTTSINNILKYGVDNALPSASPISGVGTLDLNGFSGAVTPTLLQTATNSSATPSTLTLNAGNTLTTSLSGNLSVRFSSPDTVVYNPAASPSYTGSTTIDAPVTFAAPLPSTTSLTINSGARLQLFIYSSTVASLQGSGTLGGTPITVANTAPDISSVSILSDFTKLGPASFTSLVPLNQMTSLSVVQGTFIVGAQNVFPGVNSIRIYSTFEVNGFNTTLKNLHPDGAGVVNNASATPALVSLLTPFFGVVAVSFTGNLSLNIPASTLMTGHSTYTGSTTAGNGLKNGAHNALPISTTLSVSGTYDLSGFDQQLAAMPFGTITNTAATPSTFLLSAPSFSSVAPLITGNINFAKSGAGNLPLGFPNTYTGSTSVYLGTLRCTVSSALPATTTVFLNPNTVLNITDTLQSIRALAGSGTVTGSGTLTLTGAPDMILATTFVGPLSLTATGQSNITITSPANYTGATTFNGFLTYTAPGNAVGELHGTGNLVIDDTASLTSDRVDINTLTIRGTHTLRPNTGTSAINALSLLGSPNNWTSRIEINNNPLAIQATANKSAVLSTLQNQIAYGLSHPNGITSNTTQSDPTHKTTVAIDNALLHLTTFFGQPVNDNTLLIASTWFGDSNLDRKVNVTDLGTLATFYGQAVPNGPLQGDFNNDGLVNVTDLGLLATNYGQGTAPGATFSLESDLSSFSVLSSAFPSSVPEPTSLALLLPLTLLLLRPKPRSPHPS